MRINRLPFIGLLLALAPLCRAGNWPTWRGPTGDDISDEKNPPLSWSATQNITWKTPLPAGGNSTPIVWDNRVFVTCAAKQGAVRSLICFDRDNGKMLWTADTPFPGHEPSHPDNPWCASSPVTDGKCIFAWFGSAGAVACDFTGRQLWKTDLGSFQHIWGNASSPVLYKDNLILNCGPGIHCFLVALNQETGKQAWKKELPEAIGKADEFKGSWSSPVLADIGGKTEMLLALPGYLAAFDPDTGEELWRCKGLSQLAYANPLVGKDVIVAMSGYGGPAIGLQTPRAEDRGDLTETHRLWVTPNNPQRIGTGILIDNRVYILNEPGIAQCIDARTGKILWKARAAGSTWGSTVFVDGKFFTTDQSGQTLVWQPGEELQILNQNALGEKTRATPAFSDGQVFIRTYENLYCIGKRTAK